MNRRTFLKSVGVAATVAATGITVAATGITGVPVVATAEFPKIYMWDDVQYDFLNYPGTFAERI